MAPNEYLIDITIQFKQKTIEQKNFIIATFDSLKIPGTVDLNYSDPNEGEINGV
jgi:hypothetical protein